MRVPKLKPAKIWQLLMCLAVGLGVAIACSSSPENSGSNRAEAGPHTYDVAWEISFSNPKILSLQGHETFTSEKKDGVAVPLPPLLRFLSTFRADRLNKHLERYVAIMQSIKAKDGKAFEKAIEGLREDAIIIVGGGAKKLPARTRWRLTGDLLRYRQYLNEKGVSASLRGSGLLTDFAEPKQAISNHLANPNFRFPRQFVLMGDTLEAIHEIEDWDRAVSTAMDRFREDRNFDRIRDDETDFFLAPLQRLLRGLEHAWLMDESFDLMTSARPSDQVTLPGLESHLRLLGSDADTQAILGELRFLLGQLSSEITVAVRIEKINAKSLREPVLITKKIDVKEFMKKPFPHLEELNLSEE